MKILTIQQPWAWAIVAGAKRVENRPWATPYRGPVAIHAGKGTDWDEAGRAWFAERGVAVPADLPRGEIVALAELVDCLAYDLLAPADLLADPYASGPWCLRLADVRPLAEPVPWRGQLGLLDLPPFVAARVRAACGQAAA